MTPQQKLMLAAKQSSQRIVQLENWLTSRRPRIPEAEAGLMQSLRGYAAQIEAVQDAAEQAAAIGLASDRAATTAMLRAYAALGARPAHARRYSADNGASHAVDPSLVDQFYRNSGDSLSTALRLVGPEAPRGPHGFPYRIRLLGVGDLAAITTRAYYAAVAGAYTTSPRFERITAVYERTRESLSAAPVRGFGSIDVLRLRNMLATLFPSAEGLRVLGAAGYWDDMEAAAEHLPESQRIEALSLLWNEDAALTRLFSELCGQLTAVSYSLEAYCPPEAVITVSGATGWRVMHPESIADWKTQQKFLDDTGEPLRIVSRYGQAANLPRAAVAALTAELSLALAITQPRSGPLPEAIILPAHAPEAAARDQSLPTPPSSDQIDLDAWAVTAFATAKNLHLIDRAIQHHDLTSLVASVDPAGPADDALAPAIADWVDQTHGREPFIREQVADGLFVTFPAEASTDPRDGLRHVARQERVATTLAHGLGSDQVWPQEWTPGLPFQNYFPLLPMGADSVPSTSPSGPFDGYRSPTAAKAPAEPASADDYATPFGSAWIAGWGTALERNRENRISPPLAGGYAPMPADLADALASAALPMATPRQKLRQLRRQLSDIDHQVRSRVLRLADQSEQGEVADWRRRLAILITRRLAIASEKGRFGLMLRAFSVTEHELIALYWRVRQQGWPDARSDTALDIAFADGADQQATRYAYLAETAAEYWVGNLRQAARSPRLGRHVQLSAPLLANLADEIACAAGRLALGQTLSAALAADLAGSEDEEVAVFAITATAVLNGFLEQLDLPGAAAHSAAGQARSAFAGASVAPLQGFTQPAVSGRFDGRWRQSFLSLVEANIDAARFLQDRQQDLELARLMSQFPPNEIEVEL
ncbi:MAG: hypothetical protein KDJ36_11225 [Hyphomicrobiaceae bacterium]|nr:hypothetical protein [Hyphomicrobiaceae bacterium]